MRMPFAEYRIGHRDQRHHLDLGVHVDEILDFLAADLLAAAIDEILAAAFGVDVAAFRRTMSPIR
jgi:hypothetical protein